MAMCIYNNCSAVQKPFSSLAFFALPKDHRRQLWIENSGNQELLNLSETARRVVCQKHFHPSALRIQFHRTILSRDAVPERWDADKLNDHSCMELKILESEDTFDVRLQLQDEVIDGDDDGVIQGVNDWENNSTDQDEGIKFIEVDSDVHSQTVDECADYDNSEIGRCQQKDTNQFVQYHHEIEIETAGSRKRKATNDQSSVEIKSEVQRHENDAVQCKVASSDVSVSSSTSKTVENDASATANAGSGGITSEEDKYFAMAMVGMLQRISPQQKAFAKVNILRYLTELEYGIDATIN